MQKGYRYINRVMDNSLTKYYFNGLLDLPWIPILNLRKVFQYEFEIKMYEIPIIDELKLTMEKIMEKNNIEGKIISMFFNYFENGKNRIPYHKDSYQTNILTLSLGGKRRFRIKNDKTKKSIGFDLRDGDLFFMTKEFNDKNKHSIMATKKKVEPRISVVFFIQK